MSLARRLFSGKARFSALAGMLALPFLASCAYNDGYYDPTPGYGYDYGGYGGYGYGGYGYGGYGSGGYGYGNPCWPYGCDDWHHGRHHRHGWGDDGSGDNSHHHHHGGGDMSGGAPPRGLGPQANDAPNPGKRFHATRAPSPPTVWIPQPKDSKN